MYAGCLTLCQFEDPYGSKLTRGLDTSRSTLPLRRSKANKYNRNRPMCKLATFNVLPAQHWPSSGLIVSLQFDFLPVYL